MEIAFEQAEHLKEKPKDESKLGFGSVFSDYMFSARYTEGEGWHDARIVPFGPFSVSPAAKVLHYDQEVFEGLKAYRTKEGKITLFRPEKNFARMNASAKRLAMPEIPEEDMLAALRELVRIEKDWVPHADGTSLYIRPNYIGIDPYLGVARSKNYLFQIITGPVGPYYAHGLAPVRILIEETYSRAARGGVGAAKTGGSYAASMLAGVEAAEKGCEQVLWLDAAERKYVQEVGSMNIMFVVDKKIVTPPLDGTILPGITRASAIELARFLGMDVEERKISVDEMEERIEDGSLTEAFGTGTAAVISPVGEFVLGEKTLTVAGGTMGPVAKLLYEALTDIQYGRGSKYPFDWSHVVA